MPYNEYLRTCPPDLKTLGIFEFHFDKWPESFSLQPTAVKIAINRLPAHYHSTRYGLSGEQRPPPPQQVEDLEDLVKDSSSAQVVVADRRKKAEAETASADIVVRLDGVLDRGDFPTLPPMPHSSSIGLGQLVSSGTSM